MDRRPKSKHRPWDRLILRPIRTRTEFYHIARWTRESRRFRQEHPLCSKCKEEGFVYPSEVTDHIIPLEICADPWDRKNWDGLCKKHNNIKAAQDKILIQKYKKTTKI